MKPEQMDILAGWFELIATGLEFYIPRGQCDSDIDALVQEGYIEHTEASNSSCGVYIRTDREVKDE